MFRRPSHSFFAVLAAAGIVAGCLAVHAQDNEPQHGRKYKAPPLAAHIEVLVVRDYNGKPIPQAHVIFHPVEGDRDKGSLEIKTNDDGKAVINVIPIGDTVRLQVIANGFQTYGHDYKIDKTDMTMEVRLKRPTGQFSLYGNSTAKSGTESGSGSDKPSSTPPESAPPASSDKPAGSSSQSNESSNSSQPNPQTN